VAFIPPDPFSSSVGSVAQFQVEDNGTLTALNPSALPSVLSDFLVVDPTNQYLFVPSEDSGTPSEFGIGDYGTLALEPAPAVAGTSIAFTPGGEFAIIPESFDSTVTSYRLDAAGALSTINTVPTGNWPEVAVVDSSGKFAYVSNSNDGTISEYRISPGGRLVPIGSVPGGGYNPFLLVVSPMGFLYSGPRNSGSVTEFAINRGTGALTRVGTYVISNPSQGGPVWMSFDSSGRNAYVGNYGEIAQFRVNEATGALVSNGTTAELGNGLYLWGGVDPSGRFLFGAGLEAGPGGDGAYGTIGSYIIDSNGALIPNGSLSLGANMVPEGFTFVQR
jgi:6-phosphogluconolactonase (cycloisomerase 2 family)